jgi:hypothetical protein
MTTIKQLILRHERARDEALTKAEGYRHNFEWVLAEACSMDAQSHQNMINELSKLLEAESLLEV